MLVGVVAGFIAWLVVWIGVETIVSAASPGWFGEHQRAFQSAITDGAPFQPDSTILAIHVLVGGLVAALSGVISTRLSGEHSRTPVIIGVVLTVLGLMKALMSWSLVPTWYHVAFTLALLIMAIVGGRAVRAR